MGNCTCLLRAYLLPKLPAYVPSSVHQTMWHEAKARMSRHYDTFQTFAILQHKLCDFSTFPTMHPIPEVNTTRPNKHGFTPNTT